MNNFAADNYRACLQGKGHLAFISFIFLLLELILITLIFVCFVEKIGHLMRFDTWVPIASTCLDEIPTA
jgi:hypothetical protein